MALALRPYQSEVFAAVAESVVRRRGLVFSVEIARQGGKNELSAQIELSALTMQHRCARNIIKCSPTFVPQAYVSMTRLKDRLDEAGFAKRWASEHGYIIRLGHARAIFLSAKDTSRVVGHTAHLLLEVDEAQDVDKEKYSKEFRPMAATTNATTVLYGTPWDDSTLLEETKQTNLELQRKDGIKRHFSYDWQEVAKYNPDYLKYVESERQRLGEDHPLFRTQYRLLPVRAGGGFLNEVQRAQMHGDHRRSHSASTAGIYVAGIDLAGEAEETDDRAMLSPGRQQDSTVVTIAQLDYSNTGPLPKQPAVRVVEHIDWTGERHANQYARLIDLLRHVWACKRIVVDATGVGQPVCSFLREALGPAVSPFVFTAPSKSEIGFNLLAAVNSGRLKLYTPDGSRECQTFWTQMEKARSFYRPSQTMNFYVDPSDGHDDFLMSLALVVEAANQYEPRTAKGRGSA